MKTTWFLVGSAAAFLVAGCETLPPGAERGPDGTMAYEVPVDASPPGARVEVNGEYVGNTPLRLKIFGDRDGTFHDFGSYYYVIRALPLETNQYAQVRVYRTGHLLTPQDHIPPQINFDMNQPSQAYPPPGGVYYYPPGPPAYYYPPPYYYGPEFRFYYGPRFHRRW